MQWKVIRDADSDLVTLRVGSPDEPGFQELTLPNRVWARVAESIADLDRPEPPSSWFSGGGETH